MRPEIDKKLYVRRLLESQYRAICFEDGERALKVAQRLTSRSRLLYCQHIGVSVFVVAKQLLFQVLQIDISNGICCDLHGSIAA